MSVPTVNTESLAEKVKERIKIQLIDLIPDEVFKATVDDVVDDFINGTKKYQETYNTEKRKYERIFNGNREEHSGLYRLLYDQITKLAKEKIDQEINNTFFSATWVDGKYENKVPAQVLKELSPVIIESFIATVVGTAVNNARYAIQQAMSSIPMMR